MATITYRVKRFAALEKELTTAPELVQGINRDALGHAVELVKALGQDAMPTGPGHFGFHAKERFHTSVTPLATTGIVAINAVQARWLEAGTQPHEIPHKSSFHIDDPRIVHHPGERPRHLMRNTLRRANSAIKAMFKDAIREAVQAMADRINGGE